MDAADSMCLSLNYVDLGLPSGTLWATCNLGVDKPEDSGYFYAWGETHPKEQYSLKDYKWYSVGSQKYTAYCTDSIYGIVDSATVLKSEDDAATVILGEEWRIPTREEAEELINECEWRWVSNYYTGATGNLGTSKRNGNTIFLPAAGHIYRDALNGQEKSALYQTSSLDKDVPMCAWLLFFTPTTELCVSFLPRFRGVAIRPVFAPKK